MHLAPPTRVTSPEFHQDLSQQKTRIPRLSSSMVCVIIRPVVLIECWLVTDRHRAIPYAMLAWHLVVKSQNRWKNQIWTRMWANAQRDGHPAEYVAAYVQRRKVWLMPTTRLPCSNAAVTRNALKFAWVPVPQTRQQISSASRPKFAILYDHIGEILLFMAALCNRGP